MDSNATLVAHSQKFKCEIVNRAQLVGALQLLTIPLHSEGG